MAHHNGRTQPDENVEERLLEQLELLRSTPERNAQAAEQGRVRFMAELDALPGIPEAEAWPSQLIRRVTGRIQRMRIVEEIKMNANNRRFSYLSIGIFIIFLFFLFAGTGMTAVAAQSALPGDALYPVKTTLERTQVSLARDAAAKAQLQLQFAERRLDEISGLIAEGRFTNIAAAAQEFEKHIDAAMAEMGLIVEGDPAQAAELMLQITGALSKYAQNLNLMLNQVPEPVKVEMERALAAAERGGSHERSGASIEFTGIVETIGQDQWVISGQTVLLTPQTEVKGSIQVGQRVKVHAFQNEGVVLTAREIELAEASGEDSANDNSSPDANSNSNNNLNVNENANGNTNGNVNSNANTNTNSNTNTNTNTNTNFNRNSNEDWDDKQNSNTNANSNTNTNSNSNNNGDWNNNQNTNTNMNSNNNNNDNGNSNQNSNSNTNSNSNDNDDDDDDDYEDGDDD